jgi:translation initiation factor IF-1
MADALEMDADVLEAHRGGLYVLDASVGALRRRVLARLSGRLVQHHIKVIAGDRVRVDVSPYDLGRGRITRRL